jgi:glycosyltransferase involved in cell wall biosynthesis
MPFYPLKEKTINYWFRKPTDHYFSIENVFNGVAQELAKRDDMLINKQYVPCETTSFKNFYKNKKFARQNTGFINHVTGDIYYITAALKGKKILTIHDFVLFRRTQHFFKKKMYKKFWYTNPIQAADIVTVISPQIEKELYDNFRVDDKKVRLIPNFLNPYFLNFRNINRPTGNKILFIGDSENKNLINVIHALTGLNIALVIVGKLSDAVVRKLQHAKISYESCSSITNEALGDLYKKCSLLLFPSLYEGFGLPIIEAQSTGLPVITSNINPMKWVAGNGAVLVNPQSVSEIRQAVIGVFENDLLRTQIVNAGFENIKRFSLSSIALLYAGCYQTID